MQPSETGCKHELVSTNSLENTKWKFSLYGQSLHFWSVLKWVWTVRAREFSFWFYIKGSFNTLQKVYSLCVLHETINPTMLDQAKVPSAVFYSALGTEWGFWEHAVLFIINCRSSEVPQTHLQLPWYPIILHSLTCLQPSWTYWTRICQISFYLHLELEVLLLVLIYFQRTFFVFILSYFVHV